MKQTAGLTGGWIQSNYYPHTHRMNSNIKEICRRTVRLAFTAISRSGRSTSYFKNVSSVWGKQQACHYAVMTRMVLAAMTLPA
jgi:hypothetical protein